MRGLAYAVGCTVALLALAMGLSARPPLTIRHDVAPDAAPLVTRLLRRPPAPLASPAIAASVPRPDAWTLTGSMHHSRAFQIATLLLDGRVLVAGGCDAPCGDVSQPSLSTAEVYDPHSGAWTPTGSMRHPRLQYTMTVLHNGEVLAAGGCATTGCTSVLAGAELYNPRTGRWTPTGSMTAARQGHTATLLPDGRVLVAGGCGTRNCTILLASAELYDPRTGRWTPTSSMHNARDYFGAALLPGGKVLVAGGCPTSTCATDLASAELYDPRTGVWTLTGALHFPRIYDTSKSATVLADGRVLVAGQSNGAFNASVELYDPRSGVWTVAGSMHDPRSFQTETQLRNGEVLEAGGQQSGAGFLASAELFDPLLAASAPPSGSWTLTGSMRQSQSGGSTATLLPDGRVLVAGGCDAPCSNRDQPSLGTAELYDPRSGAWTLTGSMYRPRLQYTMTVLHNGEVLAAGGCATTGCTNVLASAELYNPRTGRWTPTGSMRYPRALHTATLLPDGWVLVAGGCSAECTDTLSSAELYDPRSGRWTLTGFMNDARIRASAALLPSGKVLVAGGCSMRTCAPSLNSAEVYDPRSGAWTPTGSMTDARQSFSLTLLRTGRVLVAGGYNNPDPRVSAEVYDPRTGRWTPTGALHFPRGYETSDSATMLADGRVLVAGQSGIWFNASAELYDPRSGVWTVAGSMHDPRSFQTETQLRNGEVLEAGGQQNSTGADAGFLASAELFHP